VPYRACGPGPVAEKLKDKAQKALEPSKPAAGNTGQGGQETQQEGNTGNAVQKNSKKDWLDTSLCKVVFTLNGASGEYLLYDETSVVADNNKISYGFVVSNKKYEYFLIEDGKRSGPFKEPPVNSLKRSPGSGGGKDDDDMIQMGNDKKDPVAMQYSKTIGGKLHIVFNGKNYGPYDNVAKMLVSADKKKFFAIVTMGGATAMVAQMGMGNNYLVNEAGLKQKLGGDMTIPYQMKLSPGFKHAMATVMDNGGQKVFSFTSASKKTEGSMADLYGNGGGLLMVSDAGDIVQVPAQSPTQILLNGNEAASFKVPITSEGRLFLLPDIKKSVYYQGGRLYRGDGTVEDVSYITFPKVATINGETAIYFYKMRKNDAGDTDVYLCKKAL
jgi:hypothetical protein